MVCLFSFSYRISGLNRSLIYSPRQIFECAIPLIRADEEADPYYDKELVKSKYEEYLDSVVYRYVDTYNVDYYFYSPSTNGVCDVNDCQGVEIFFEAKVTSFYTYKSHMFYEIKRMM